MSELDFDPDGWSEFCSKELAGLRELKISPCSCCYRFGRKVLEGGTRT